MKSIITISILSVILTCSVGCTPLLFKIKGVKKPGLESTESTLNYLQKKMPDTNSRCFIAKDSLRIKELYDLIGGLPVVDFFTGDGKLIRYSETGSCTGKADDFSKGLEPGKEYPIDPKYLFSDIMNRLTEITSEGSTSMSNCDFIVAVYWAKYAGSLNNSAFGIVKNIQDNKRISASIVYVNLDFQASWGIRQVPRVVGL